MPKDLKNKMIEGFKKALELTKKANSLNVYGDDYQFTIDVEFNDNNETFSLEIDEIESDNEKDIKFNIKDFSYSLSFGDVKVELTKKEHEKLVDKFKEKYKIFEDKKEKKVIEKLDELINF